MDSYSSIIYDTDTVFFVEGIQDKNSAYLKELLDFIQQMPAKTNRWIFFLTLNTECKKALELLLNNSNVLSFEIDPLRKRTAELSSIISLYVYEFRILHNKDIIGFEPSALEMLKNYDWPGNIEQLKKAVEELVILSPNSFITKKSVASYLQQTQREYSLDPTSSLNTKELHHKSLEEIKQMIIKQLVIENKGNKTKTAQELRISRSTLWRYLK